MVKRCNCKHEYQDKVYGVGMRVHNEVKKDSAGKNAAARVEYRCTVCGVKS